MAIIKAIELDNGITVNYHRIVVVTSVVNNRVTIEVASYINKSQREKEKKAIEEFKPVSVFIHSQWINIDFDFNFSVADAYNYLKSLEDFKGGEDDPGE
jgi:hypothetical protein